MEKQSNNTTLDENNELEDLGLIVTNTFETEDFDATEEFLAKCTSIHACQVCDEVFRRRKDLLLHMNESYDCRTKKIFRCVECQQTFPTVGEFQLHLVSHSQEEPSSPNIQEDVALILCELCGKDFNNATEKKKHLESHFEKNGSILCPTCGKCLCSKEMYTKHSLAHNYQSGKTQKIKKNKHYECKICNKSFISSSSLRDHLDVHTGEKSFECNFCKKILATKGSLRCHLKLHFKPDTSDSPKSYHNKKSKEKDQSDKKEKLEIIKKENRSNCDKNSKVKNEKTN